MSVFSRALAPLVLTLLTAVPAPAQELVVSFGGDVNFARSRQRPLPDQIHKFGALPIEMATEALSRYWTSDLNLINVETVVSDRDGASSPTKAFVFRSHPESFRHLMDLGVNGFSLANNHAFDHGRQGLRDTLSFFRHEQASRLRPLLFAGIGRGAEAFTPAIGTFNGVRVAFASASFGSGAFRPSGDDVGMTYLTVPSDFAAVLRGLRDARADIRILSLHYGTENMIQLNAGQRALFRRGIEEAGVNLVIGHHPHVVRAVEAAPEKGQAIFYSMGNLLFIGGAEKDSAPLGQDYGLLGRAYFQRTGAEGWRITALEAAPMRSVHLAPEPVTGDRLRRTIDHLNRLSALSVGADAVAFTPSPLANQPTGLACFGANWGPRAAALCCARTAGPNPQCDLPDPM
ncbi:CapA family protein [Pseudooceanicola nanhaiensis]|uniref:CapA family protein n=1 Tax=Pseudooceanicola nanhaiensis TaxID=375761 RepID=UPI001CD23B65|nr:CapA family protein [Pseudooceanicola nanhaiensis]MCA0921167.1 CapA family protein [Pseudooceanicola nanhaiensis]